MQSQYEGLAAWKTFLHPTLIQSGNLPKSTKITNTFDMQYTKQPIKC